MSNPRLPVYKGNYAKPFIERRSEIEVVLSYLRRTETELRDRISNRKKQIELLQTELRQLQSQSAILPSEQENKNG